MEELEGKNAGMCHLVQERIKGSLLLSEVTERTRHSSGRYSVFESDGSNEG